MPRKPPTRKDRPFPMLTCTNCGETKKATRFPKRGDPAAKKYKVDDPRRYGKQCKLCLKPVPANAGDDYVHEEPKRQGSQRGAKKRWGPKGSHRKKVKVAKKARKKRSDSTGLNAKELKQKTRIETRIKSMLYLSEKGCEECGERDPRKLEYDHKKPSDKKRGIARLIADNYSWSSPVLRREIRKCRILCANCHRVHTIKQQGYYASTEVQNALSCIAADYDFEV